MEKRNPLVHSDPDVPTRRSLILAGGGMRLAYQAGVLIALEESDLTFSHVDGTSGGIFNTAMLASGLQPNEMAERWRELNVKYFMSMSAVKDYLKPLNMKGYTDADGIRTKVFPQLKINLNTIRTNNHINATFNVCNFSEKSIEAISHRHVKEDHLIAGVSLPIVMPAIKIDGTWYTDAVWIKDANLLEGVKQQSEELWLVWAIGNCSSYLPGALNQYVHMIEMSANGSLLDEYNQIKKINEAVAENKSEYGQRKPIRLFVIKPEYPLPLDPDLFFDKIDARTLINMGYADAKQCLSTMPSGGVSMDKEATKMKEPGLRLNFRGTFQANLNWNNAVTEVKYHIYFCFRNNREKNILHAYSSLYVKALDREIPLYDHRIKCTPQKNLTLLEVSARLIHGGKSYTVKASFKLGSPVDFLIGLELKQVSLTVTDADTIEQATILKGVLHQSTLSRLRSFYQTNVRTEEGGAGGFRKRYSLFSKLMAYEV